MSHSSPAGQEHGQRAVAPIRWPRPAASTIVLLLVWILGVVIGILGPALIVPSGAGVVDTPRALTAFGVNAVGALIMVVVGALLYRRERDGGLAVFTIVPSGAVLLSGMVMLGTKLQFA